MCQRNELILGVGQVRVDRRRERVFLIAALRYAPIGAPQVVAAMQTANDILATQA